MSQVKGKGKGNRSPEGSEARERSQREKKRAREQASKLRKQQVTPISFSSSISMDRSSFLTFFSLDWNTAYCYFSVMNFMYVCLSLLIFA